jgi:hypothetical protein
MKTTENFACFIDEASGVSVFVDSFDNQEFEVRLGDILASEIIGKFIAADDNDLNKTLTKLVEGKLH